MISVCMATYNGEKYIKEQLLSILSQLSEEDEIIISDDNSTDNTISIIKSLNDKRIKILIHKRECDLTNIKRSKNFYFASKNFENALTHSKGELIFLSDQDDVWLPGRKKKMLDKLNSNDCVMCNFILIDSNGQRKVEKYYSRDPVGTCFLKNVVKSGFLGCCMAFNRDVLNYSLPFPKKLIAHDGWIGCLSLMKYKFAFILEPLHLYRRTDSNVSTMANKSTNPLWYKIFYRLIFLNQLFIHSIKKIFHKG